LAGVLTAGSITQSLAPMLMTVADDRYRMPTNTDVVPTIKKTENVMPTSKAANFPLSFTSSLYAILRIPCTDILHSSWNGNICGNARFGNLPDADVRISVQRLYEDGMVTLDPVCIVQKAVFILVCRKKSECEFDNSLRLLKNHQVNVHHGQDCCDYTEDDPKPAKTPVDSRNLTAVGKGPGNTCLLNLNGYKDKYPDHS